MANFQRLTLTIAGILFIIIIIILSYVLFNANSNQTWPPIIPSCPDYWLDLSGNGAQCINPKESLGLGKCGTAPDFTQGEWAGTTGNCQKYLWAKNTCDVAWDGITYGVANPCDSSNNST